MSAITDHHSDNLALRPGGGKAGIKNALRKTGSAAATAILIVAVAALLFLAIGPRLLGYQTHSMLTGSMSPLIKPGDVVVTQTVPLDQIHVGDIITYDIPVEDHRTVTHRVAEILADDNGRLAFRTKGDANPGRDPWSAVLDGPTASRHIFTIPYLGTAIRMLREPPILNTLLYGAPAFLTAGALTSIWKRPKSEAEAPNSRALQD
ncbi:UNVERIFIED_ORG: signal peptidase [Arthrobacter sp. UYEF2]